MIKMMTKQELYETLKRTGQIHRPKKTSIWETAFDMYIKQTGDPVSMGCSKCYSKVTKWLKK